MIKFCWQSGSQFWILICIATLVSHALVEVCTVPVLLINHDTHGWCILSGDNHHHHKNEMIRRLIVHL